MEELLERVSREASAAKMHALCLLADEARSFSESQQGLLRDPPWELRARFLLVVREVLHGRPCKLTPLVIQGLQKMLRDDRFVWQYDSDDEHLWLTTQLLDILPPACQLTCQQVRLDILRVLLSVTGQSSWVTSGGVVLRIVALCHDYAGGLGAPLPAGLPAPAPGRVHTGAVACCCQAVRGFCSMLDEEYESVAGRSVEDRSEAPSRSHSAVTCIYDECADIYVHVCQQLETAHTQKDSCSLGLYLSTLAALLTSLNATRVRYCRRLLQYTWRHLVPVLVALLGSPPDDRLASCAASTCKLPATGKTGSLTDGGHCPGDGGSRCIQPSQQLQPTHARIVHSVCVHLVRLFGGVADVRPALESLFSRLLLYPATSRRHDALRTIHEIFASTELLVSFCAPVDAVDSTDARYEVNDLGLLLIAMQCVSECHSTGETALLSSSVQCCAALMLSLQALATGQSMCDRLVHSVNSLYPRLHDADFTGVTPYKRAEPVYQHDCSGRSRTPQTSLARTILPDGGGAAARPRRTSVFSESSLASSYLPRGHCAGRVSSETTLTGYETDNSWGGSDCGGDEYCDVASIGSVEEGAVHTESRDAELARLERLRDEGFVNNPSTLSYDCSTEQERRNCRHFVRALCSQLTELVHVRTGIAVDQALQEFASKYCDGVYSSLPSISRLQPGSLVTIVNADGIYLATYAALRLNWQLSCDGYYAGDQAALATSEADFIEEVLGCGVLVYLSASWLAELYQQLLAGDLLATCLQTDIDQAPSALINLISDLDVLSEAASDGHLLSDCRRLARASSVIDPAAVAGSKLGRRILTACWTPAVHVLRSLAATGRDSGAASVWRHRGVALVSRESRRQHRRLSDAATLCLLSLQRTARLCNTLGLQGRCECVVAQLTAAVCCVGDNGRAASGGATGRWWRRPPPPLAAPPRLVASHAANMRVLMSHGLQLASHCDSCWPHLFRCFVFVADLEQRCFRSTMSCRVSVPSPPAVSASSNVAAAVARRYEVDAATRDYHCLPFASSTMLGQQQQYKRRQHQSVDPYAYLRTAETPDDVISTPSLDSSEQPTSPTPAGGTQGMNDELCGEQLASVVCEFSQMVDRLFDDAACRLNLASLLSFVRHLCRCSQHALFDRHCRRDGLTGTANSPSNNCGGGDGATMLLSRVGETMSKVATSGRPLLHCVRVWSVVSQHLMEAACHSDAGVSKLAVCCLHDAVAALLSGCGGELAHFHLHEALFKPFETLLRLEVCDAHVQDQIIGCICAFVELHTAEIRSGWRPLFGALRSLHSPLTPCSQPLCASPHASAVLDVFAAFLCTDSVHAFAHAAVDCIQCLLKHVRASGDSMDPGASVADDLGCRDTVGNDTGDSTTPHQFDICRPALDYLTRCHNILACMYKMPDCPVFQSAHRIQVCTSVQLVEPSAVCERADDDRWAWLEDMQWQRSHHSPSSHRSTFTSFTPAAGDGQAMNDEYDDVEEHTEASVGPRQFATAEHLDVLHDVADAVNLTLRLDPADETVVSLNQLDTDSGVLRVWCLLLEGVMSAAVCCARQHQPTVMETVFSLLHSLPDAAGVEFGVFCVNHLLLPLVQRWLRTSATSNTSSTSATSSTSSTDASVEAATRLNSVRQAFGQLTDLTVAYHGRLTEGGSDRERAGFQLLLKQLVLLLCECCLQHSEVLARIGCACFRHLVVSCGRTMRPQHWRLVCAALHRSLSVSVAPLCRLLSAYTPGELEVYGRAGGVMVAATRDSCSREALRLCQLAVQVFMVDTGASDACHQHVHGHRGAGGDSELSSGDVEDDRSYVLLLKEHMTHGVQVERECNSCLDAFDAAVDSTATCVSFRQLIVGLVAHQLLLQVVGTILLTGFSRSLPSVLESVLAGYILEDRDCTSAPLHADVSNGVHSDEVAEQYVKVRTSSRPLPGHLNRLASRDIHVLLTALTRCQLTTAAFERRPGLKFLLGKLAGLPHHAAASLQRHAALAATLRLAVVYELAAAEVAASPAVSVSQHLRPTPPCDRQLYYVRQLWLLARWHSERFCRSLMPRDETAAAHGESRDTVEASQPLAARGVDRRAANDRDGHSGGSEDEDNTSDKSTGDSGVATRLQHYSDDVQRRHHRLRHDPTHVNQLLLCYRRHKASHQLPPHPRAVTQHQQQQGPTLPPDMQQQRTLSLLEDGEVNVRVWTSVLCVLFEWQCDESRRDSAVFRQLLPALCPAVTSLTAHTLCPAQLRHSLAALFQCIASVYQFSPD